MTCSAMNWWKLWFGALNSSGAKTAGCCLFPWAALMQYIVISSCPEEKQPCSKIGANRQAKKKVAADPALKEYRSVYQRLNKRVEQGYMEKDAFQVWAKEAKSRCIQCQNGEITFEEYKKWLDETSRQRKVRETE